jgi:hypothetical protein
LTFEEQLNGIDLVRVFCEYELIGLLVKLPLHTEYIWLDATTRLDPVDLCRWRELEIVKPDVDGIRGKEFGENRQDIENRQEHGRYDRKAVPAESP